MLLQINSIKPNPFRNLDKYPINREKVENLKISIINTGFWDNLLLRYHNDEYQLAYGHHRLIALQELDFNEIDCVVRPLNDSDMIRIMANENMEQWGTNPVVIFETVLAARNYLNEELSKYDDWNDVPQGLMDSLDLSAKSAFQNAKTKGVGQTTILKFLGSNWKQHVIQSALLAINAVEKGDIDKESIELLPTISHVERFIPHARKLSIEKQRTVVKRVIDEEIGAKNISSVLIEEKWKPEKKKLTSEEINIKNRIISFEKYLKELDFLAKNLMTGLVEMEKMKSKLGTELFTEANSALRVTLFLSLSSIKEKLDNFLTIYGDEKSNQRRLPNT